MVVFVGIGVGLYLLGLGLMLGYIMGLNDQDLDDLTKGRRS